MGLSEIERLARETIPEQFADVIRYTASYATGGYCAEIQAKHVHSKSGLYTADQMHAHALKVAALALEEAARLCEQRDEDGEGPDCWDWHAKDYAAAIRSLIPK